MASSLFGRRRAERFARLLAEKEGQPRQHVRTGHDPELRPLVETAERVSAALDELTPEPSEEFRAGLRAILINTAERGASVQQIPAAPAPPAPPPNPPGPPPGHGGLSGTGRRSRTWTAILIGVVAGALMLSGVSAASNDALPGDPLYPVKRSTEQAQFALAGSDANRGQLSLGFARVRLNEARLIGGDLFGSVLDDMDEETRQGVKLLTTTAARRQSTETLDTVTAFAVNQRAALNILVDNLPAPARARVRASIILLDAVEERARALRPRLPCNADKRDELGPLPQPCVAMQ